MQTFRLKYAENRKTIFGALLPLMVVIPAVITIALYSKDLGDSGLIALVIAAILFGVIAPLFLVLKASRQVDVSIDENEIRFSFINPNFLTPANFSIQTGDILNFWREEYQGRPFCSFKLKVAPKQFNLSPVKPTDAGEQALFSRFNGLIEERVKNYNTLNDTQPIASVTMFETVWAKLGAVILAVSLLTLWGASITVKGESYFPWWKLLTITVLGLPFILKVWQYNFGSKKRS